MRFLFGVFISVFLTNDVYSCKPNSIIHINKTNLSDFVSVYIERDGNVFYEDSVGLVNDSILLFLDDPIGVSVYINNDLTTLNNIYLEKGEYLIDIDVLNRSVEVIGSKINDEYKEKMRIYDSLSLLYDLPKGLHPAMKDYENKKQLVKKYMPLVDSLSSIHIKRFYEQNPTSFLSLEHIFIQSENPKYKEGAEKAALKKEFDRLDLCLKNYKMYKQCEVFFNMDTSKSDIINNILYQPK